MTRIKRNKFGMGILVAFICLCAVGCHDSGGDQDMQMEAISETEEGLYISNTAPEKLSLIHIQMCIRDSVTTMQKMANAVKRPQYAKIMDAYKDEKVVFIIDECHRSQFGDMHKDIVRHFQKAQFFGFTGTPRFEVNGKVEGKITQTTEKMCIRDRNW